MRLRGLGDRIRYSRLATVKRRPRGRAFFSEGRTEYTGDAGRRGRSGARKRKDRGLRSGVAFCQVLLRVDWETPAGEIVVNPVGTDGLTRVELRCGFPFVARHGHVHCPAHGTRTR